jgi:hypothetical protein
VDTSTIARISIATIFTKPSACQTTRHDEATETTTKSRSRLILAIPMDPVATRLDVSYCTHSVYLLDGIHFQTNWRTHFSLWIILSAILSSFDDAHDESSTSSSANE